MDHEPEFIEKRQEKEEDIAIGMEAITIWLEGITSRLEAIAGRLEGIVIKIPYE